MNCDYASLGLKIPKILLPNPTVDLSKWAVVACDQYTSQPEYWERVIELVGTEPSTLNLIFPEVYLGKANDQERILKIHQKMHAYLSKQVLLSEGAGFIYVERATAHRQLRRGLVVAIDLEAYDYHPGSQSLIRATEGTVLERIPPRVRIRQGALLEVPHVMLLMDDPEDRVLGSLAARTVTLSKAYDTDLMMDGGHLTGYRVNETEVLAEVYKGLEALADTERFNQQYGLTDQTVLLFAVGDGNHSLATAKAVWEELKQRVTEPLLLAEHPARYALVEIVNLHDPGLNFEPIHRVLFNIKIPDLFAEMAEYYRSKGIECRMQVGLDRQGQERRLNAAKTHPEAGQMIGLTYQGLFGIMELPKPAHNLAVGSLQAFLDAYLRQAPKVEIDYIHGAEILEELAAKDGNIGFYLPTLNKRDLFKTIILDGVLPRKTFSMGEAEEKRFYMECRQIASND